VGGARSR